MAVLVHLLSWRKAVGDGAAMVTEYGDEATTRTTHGTMAYRALLAGNVGVVMRWGYNGTAMVAEERSDAAQGERGGRQWRRRHCPLLRLLWVSEGGGRERNESAGRERASAGRDVVCCGSMWPSQAVHRRRVPSTWWPSAGVGRPLKVE